MIKLFEILKKAKTEITVILVVFLITFFIGFIVGRKSISFETETMTLTPVDSIPPSTGSGIMQPTVIDTNYQTFVDSIRHYEQFKLIWFEYENPQIKIEARGFTVDSVRYEMKKRWFEFDREAPIESLRVYGVAPESVKVTTVMPEKDFIIATTLTVPDPRANLIVGYKGFVIHTNTPVNFNFQKTQYGIGWLWQF